MKIFKIIIVCITTGCLNGANLSSVFSNNISPVQLQRENAAREQGRAELRHALQAEQEKSHQLTQQVLALQARVAELESHQKAQLDAKDLEIKTKDEEVISFQSIIKELELEVLLWKEKYKTLEETPPLPVQYPTGVQQPPSEPSSRNQSAQRKASLSPMFIRNKAKAAAAAAAKQAEYADPQH